MIADRVQAYLRAVVATNREPVAAGAFVLYVHPSSTHPFLNYAIPEPGGTGGDGRALIEAARSRGLTPRLEYLEECFGWVADALAPEGFTLQGRLALMTCTPGSLAEPAASVQMRPVSAGSPLVAPMLAVQHAAFEDPPPSEDAIGRWRGQAVVALHGDEVLGAAQFTDIIDGASEVGGVAVRAADRRRGIGAALTAATTRAAFDAGATLVVLTPGDEDTERVYARVGFERAATMIHLVAE